MFDAKRFCDDYQIGWTDRGKHARRGWIQIICPFCTGNPGWHGGFNVSDSSFRGEYHCWRCGWYPIYKVVSTLIKIEGHRLRTIVHQYLLSDSHFDIDVDVSRTQKASDVVFPPGTSPLQSIHKKYLVSRNFDSNKLEKEWKLKGTGPIGDSYKLMIIAPIVLDQRVVSFQGRDITGRREDKYRACSMQNERYHYKHTLYGLDHIENRCVVVEGITDVWRLGYGAVATFGIKYTKEQVRLLAQRTRQVFVLFDEDDEASSQAERLAIELSCFGVETNLIGLEVGVKDPADLSEQEVAYLRREIF